MSSSLQQGQHGATELAALADKARSKFKGENTRTSGSVNPFEVLCSVPVFTYLLLLDNRAETLDDSRKG